MVKKENDKMINVAAVGCGYLGPNLIRNFVTSPFTELLWACDLDTKQLEKVLPPYPGVKRSIALEDVLAQDTVDAVAIETPVHAHFPIAKMCLESGKHVLLEKPLASSVKQGRELVDLAKQKNLQPMCDHTFCYHGAVRKIKEYCCFWYFRPTSLF